MGRILAVDFGLRRCGIAVSDPGKMIAQPLTTVDTGTIFTYLENYLDSEKVETIVVGDPMIDAHDRSGLLEPLNEFVRGLKSRFPLMKVHRMDERFTSKIAQRTLLEAGAGKKKRSDKKLLDRISAAVLLQSWMEKYIR